jgi:hypothetical protein
MILKNLPYISVPLLSLFVLSGCGSSSDNQSNSHLSEKKEDIAIYIPLEELQDQKKFSKSKNFTLSSNKISKLIKEDAERDNLDKRWLVYDKSPDGANISIIYDDIKKSRVIEFTGNGLENGFVLGSWTKSGSWGEKNHKKIQWSMNFNEPYYIYVRISTPKGYRYLYYTPSSHNYGIAEKYDAPHYIHHGLGTNSMNGTWLTFTRDLEADLKEFDPDNNITSVDGFFVRGSGQIDDIALIKTEPSTPISTTVEERIKQWLSLKELDVVKEIIISSDKSRAMVRGHKKRRRSATLFMLDISDIENIQELNHYIYGHKGTPQEIKIKDEDYMLAITRGNLLIYNYQTGEKLSTTIIGSPYSNPSYHHFLEENRAIYSHFLRTQDLNVIDFTDRIHPTITMLHKGDKNTKYKLSEDKLKIIVTNRETNTVIKEILIKSQK